MYSGHLSQLGLVRVMLMVHHLRIVIIMIMELKQRRDLRRLRHSRGLNQHVVKLLLLDKLQDLVHQV